MNVFSDLCMNTINYIWNTGPSRLTKHAFSFLGQAFSPNPAQRPRVACSSLANHQWLTKSPGWVSVCSLWKPHFQLHLAQTSQWTCWDVYARRQTTMSTCFLHKQAGPWLVNRLTLAGLPGLVNVLPRCVRLVKLAYVLLAWCALLGLSKWEEQLRKTRCCSYKIWASWRVLPTLQYHVSTSFRYVILPAIQLNQPQWAVS